MPVKSNYIPASQVDETIPATSIAISPAGANKPLVYKKTLVVTAILTPANSTDTVTWTTSNQSVIRIDGATDQLSVTLYAAATSGVSRITVTATSGVSYNFNVTATT